jgi:hypothetical protein
VKSGVAGWWNIIESSGGVGKTSCRQRRDSSSAKYEGKSIAQISNGNGRQGPRAMSRGIWSPRAGSRHGDLHMMGEQDIETALKFPWTEHRQRRGAVAAIGATDATRHPHPRSFGNFPASSRST